MGSGAGPACLLRNPDSLLFFQFFCRKSALDLDPEAQAVMEMMGKTFVSKDVRAADEQDAKDKTKEEQNKN